LDISDEDAVKLAELADDPSIVRNVGSHSFPHPYARVTALDFIHMNREMFHKRFRFDFYECMSKKAPTFREEMNCETCININGVV
jgi:hypothetical protein